MKKLFTAIRKKDNETVKALIEKKPELVNCTAKQPPKRTTDSRHSKWHLRAGILKLRNILSITVRM